MKTYISIVLMALSFAAFAQDSTAVKSKSGLGNGLRFELDSGKYQFTISGVLQPTFGYSKKEGMKAENNFASKRTYLSFVGSALEEKVSFFVLANFSASTPLLDAWAGYKFHPRWLFSVGQRRTFTNNREMTFDEDKLQFTDRGFLSTTFNGNGREFGAFLEGSFGNSFIIAPQFALTSGDGPNSFGVNALDVDYGGIKYGARVDIYPLGAFVEGNRGFAADLQHEAKPKVLVGLAGSTNNGVSNAIGEGHGSFLTYDSSRALKLPNLHKVSADILVKYKGFSLLAEFMNTAGSNLSGIYLDSTKTASILRPGQISNYLVLGSAWNVQLGFVTKTGYALDIRYENLQPEFEKQPRSLLQKANARTVGITKYFNDNRLKLQASVSDVRYTTGKDQLLAELLFQVVL